MSKKRVNFMLPEAFPGQNQINFLLNEIIVSQPILFYAIISPRLLFPQPYRDSHTCISGVKGTRLTGRGSSIRSVSAWHASGPEFDPHVRHILSWGLGHEKNSTAILPLLLIQEEQLSVTGERLCTKYW